jgi:hypothetical protein
MKQNFRHRIKQIQEKEHLDPDVGQDRAYGVMTPIKNYLDILAPTVSAALVTHVPQALCDGCKSAPPIKRLGPCDHEFCGSCVDTINGMAAE